MRKEIKDYFGVMFDLLSRIGLTVFMLITIANVYPRSIELTIESGSYSEMHWGILILLTFLGVIRVLWAKPFEW